MPVRVKKNAPNKNLTGQCAQKGGQLGERKPFFLS